ncbi:CDP-6-deoxy-delta-3,4-glucoseen reductase [Candidatus Venteria ishoeyi]|uniref:CDP-6-deoxy-L-threo-D-glycero-4-hexulose-3-dehyd rase reductase n=1 Tax=Candidatus Venteria ishoeyi TaxID=1899563 RepID=A0A1H6F7F6_9GAMM|nr:CDP-6-deoxy-delta-3,4-glucoseen reductase [Candidatus Venteria ishoeyi]MDM8545959.1 CDP-6-deoxy-delta-3,4-glucoseen reductase [Candidatus Venteria ishoeyi]SEH06067.1 CDP-6-deoxy-L-threo-D-glycero-4-hexulose-3-dehyd rase reductase [Candidatus Venteria ishoeyi]
MSCQIHIRPSEHTFSAETDETLLDAALREGHSFSYGCRNGACGKCTGKVLDGQFHYARERDELGALPRIDEAGGEILLCQAVADTDLTLEVQEVETTKEIEIQTLPCRVVKHEQLAHDVILLGVKIPENKRLQFMAGQYVDFLLKDGRRRSFSLANAPHDDEMLEFHIRHVAGGIFTDHVFQDMQEKEMLRLEGPLGSFFVREDSERPIIMVAGGTGFAPLKGIIEHLLYVGLTRSIEIYWGARSLRDLYADNTAKQWAEQNDLIRYIPVLSEPLAEDNWRGRTGFVHEAVQTDHSDLSGHDVYACGPPVMTNAAAEAFVAQGLPKAHFYSDAFEFSKD